VSELLDSDDVVARVADEAETAARVGAKFLGLGPPEPERHDVTL